MTIDNRLIYLTGVIDAQDAKLRSETLGTHKGGSILQKIFSYEQAILSIEASKGKKALVVLTNTRTGFDLKAVSYLWNAISKEHHCTIDFSTPKGGEAPMDPCAAEESRQDEIVQEFLSNKDLVEKFRETEYVEQVSSDNYCAIFLVGAHGCLFDFTEHSTLGSIVSDVYKNGGIVGTVGHGISGCLTAKKPSSSPSPPSGKHVMPEEGSFLSGRQVACPSRAEDEHMLSEKESIPYYIDEKLVSIGACLYNKGPFEVNVCRDERLYTAQNTQSVPEWVGAIMRDAESSTQNPSAPSSYSACCHR